jgi:hypothetical protein
MSRKLEEKEVFLGVHGRQTNDARSIHFCDQIGLDYVSDQTAPAVLSRPALLTLCSLSSSLVDLLLTSLGPICHPRRGSSAHPIQAKVITNKIRERSAPPFPFSLAYR